MTAKAGVPGFVEIVLVPTGEYHCNDQYPHKFALAAASTGVTYPQTTVTAISFTLKRSVMRVPFVASAAGTAVISGKFSFAVCTADICEPQSATLSIAVPVQ